ncbi:uncharacterized protein LOC121392701 [Gigantopelta aegis]|uniref:uncharacterized protein LOC121392701 n=1 Tax=Gigantopelta aegis TaxID=1735272 RepID=UPI001B88E2E2|nr:uncharacterized protein LOC121392701 [Gigantopelta aegis]
MTHKIYLQTSIFEPDIKINRKSDRIKHEQTVNAKLQSDTECPDIKINRKSYRIKYEQTVNAKLQSDTECPDIKINSKSDRIKHEQTVNAKLQSDTECPDIKINRKSDRLKHEQTVNANLKSDIECPDLSSILVLEGQESNKIVVTDWINKCVKSFSSQHKNVQSLYRTNSRPCYLAKTRDHQVLVTLPEERKLLYLYVQDDIHLMKTVTTKNDYYDITVLPDDSMAVTRGLSGCVDILNQWCDVIRSIPNKVISNPGYLTVKGDSLVVVPDTTNIVTCVSSSGLVMWVSRDSARFRRLYGVACDTEEFVYVCDNDRHAIVQLSRDGEVIRDVITQEDGLKQPVSLCFARDKLYVTQENGEIKIFGWSQN